MDIAATPDTAIRIPTIEVRPTATQNTDIPASTDNADAKPDFWHRTFGKDGFTFSTLLDIVNPLQHIPVVSTVYQKLTGDVSSPGANVIGGALFGGPIGLLVAGADTALKSETGKSVGDHVLAMFDSNTPADATAVAANSIPAVVNSDTATAAAVAPAPMALADATSAAKAVTRGAPAPTAPKNVVKTAAPATKPITPFPFMMGASNRHTPANGIGGSFVPLESRASVAPVAYRVALPPLDSPSLSDASKLAGKPTDDVNAPDLQTLASNPGLLLQMQQNGLRKTNPNTANAAPKTVNAPTAQPAAVTAPMPAPIADSSDTTGTDDGAGSNTDYANLMARNLARYMAMQNKNTAPAKVNQRY